MPRFFLFFFHFSDVRTDTFFLGSSVLVCFVFCFRSGVKLVLLPFVSLELDSIDRVAFFSLFSTTRSFIYYLFVFMSRSRLFLFVIHGLQEFIDRYGVLAPLVVENAYRNCAQVRHRRGRKGGGGGRWRDREGLVDQ